MRLEDWNIDHNWCLFLDRDGVINRRLPDEYVRKWDEFEFLPGVLDAMRTFADVFAVIVVVTNQRGIGRGLMTESDLQLVHERMLDEIGKSGGRIDRIYHCPHDKTARCDCRKPAIGSALRAQRDFCRIDFNRSVMVGDAASDMLFAERAGLRRIWVGSDPEKSETAPELCYPSLSEFGRALADLGANRLR